ncbi:MAG: PQQ-binding-like beta-propeller repeat protein [Calditrichaeota bacterium]|nr:PQQ-binding-like beta-propeller repeat protein [Calditrichota bacterium]HQU73120.1 PQQ-binding-like beta-propeller repeat protein [Calditrichia bacterium]
MRRCFWLLMLICPFLQAQPWPSWRGPNGNGISDSPGAPLAWGAAQNLHWRLPLPGPAPSTPVMASDRLFLTATRGDSLLIMAVSRDGHPLWEHVVAGENHSYRQGESNDAAPSPSTDGHFVWAFFGSGDLICLTVNGEKQWQINIQERYGKFSTYFGMATTPLLWGEALYLGLMHDNAQMAVALDKSSGRELWRSKRPTEARNESLHSYASPVMYHYGNDPQLITHGADLVVAYNPLDGRELWRSAGLQDPDNYNSAFRLVASPVTAPGLVVAPSAKNGPVLGINPTEARGDITGQSPSLRWRMNRGTTDVPSPVIYQGLVYICRENGVLLCLNQETGEQVYEKRVYGSRHRSSPVVAGERLYMIAQDGTANVVKTGPAFELLATNRLGERVAASPVIVDGVLYLRSDQALYAFGEQR